MRLAGSRELICLSIRRAICIESFLPTPKPAETLAEFYTAVFALLLQGSTECSKEKFEKAVDHVWEVREAWRQVATDPELSEKTAELRRLE